MKDRFDLTEDDIRTPVGAGTGPYLILHSDKARSTFPFSAELKKYQSFSVYKHYEQVKDNLIPGTSPIVILEADRKKPTVLIDFDDFIALLNK